MAQLPRHPDTDDESPSGGRRRRSTRTPWGTYVLMAIVAIVVLAMVVLHLTGVVGPGAHAG
jgi:uncharacterized membrane protein